jgi:hypothetical protein
MSRRGTACGAPTNPRLSPRALPALGSPCGVGPGARAESERRWVYAPRGLRAQSPSPALATVATSPSLPLRQKQGSARVGSSFSPTREGSSPSRRPSVASSCARSSAASSRTASPRCQGAKLRSTSPVAASSGWRRAAAVRVPPQRRGGGRQRRRRGHPPLRRAHPPQPPPQPRLPPPPRGGPAHARRACPVPLRVGGGFGHRAEGDVRDLDAPSSLALRRILRAVPPCRARRRPACRWSVVHFGVSEATPPLIWSLVHILASEDSLLSPRHCR